MGRRTQDLASYSEYRLDVFHLSLSDELELKDESYSPHFTRRFRQFEQPFERPPLLTMLKACDTLARGDSSRLLGDFCTRLHVLFVDLERSFSRRRGQRSGTTSRPHFELITVHVKTTMEDVVLVAVLSAIGRTQMPTSRANLIQNGPSPTIDHRRQVESPASRRHRSKLMLH